MADIREQAGEVLVARHRLDHHRLQRASVDSEPLGRHSDRDQPRTSSERGTSAKASSATRWPATEYQGVTAGIFMGLCTRSRKDRAPEGGAITRRQRGKRGDRFVADPDRRHDQFATQLSSGQKNVTRLRAGKCHGEGGLDRAPIRPGVAMNPGRRVDGDDGNPARCNRSQDRRSRTVERSRQPGAKKRVDDEGYSHDIGILDRLDRALP